MDSMMAQEIREQPAVLERVLRENQSAFMEAADTIQRYSPEAVYIVARGTSDHVGVFAKYMGEYFLGIPFTLAASSLVNIYQRPSDFKSKLVIAISQSGRGPDVLGVVEEAKRRGGLTVGVTNDDTSPLAQISDIVLRCCAGPERSVAATKTCTSSMMALGALIGAWSSAVVFNAMLHGIPAGIDRLIARSQEIGEWMTFWGQIRRLLVVARGLNYASALETALKIQETCAIDARGYSAADLLHGPIAMANKEFPALIYAVAGPAIPSVKETAARLATLHVPLWLAGNDKELCQKVNAFYMPEILNEEVSPFYTVVFGQLVAHHLAISLGMNPDAPLGLTKITQTL